MVFGKLHKSDVIMFVSEIQDYMFYNCQDPSDELVIDEFCTEFTYRLKKWRRRASDEFMIELGHAALNFFKYNGVLVASSSRIESITVSEISTDVDYSTLPEKSTYNVKFVRIDIPENSVKMWKIIPKFENPDNDMYLEYR